MPLPPYPEPQICADVAKMIGWIATGFNDVADPEGAAAEGVTIAVVKQSFKKLVKSTEVQAGCSALYDPLLDLVGWIGKKLGVNIRTHLLKGCLVNICTVNWSEIASSGGQALLPVMLATIGKLVCMAGGSNCTVPFEDCLELIGEGVVDDTDNPHQ